MVFEGGFGFGFCKEVKGLIFCRSRRKRKRSAKKSKSSPPEPQNCDLLK